MLNIYMVRRQDSITPYSKVKSCLDFLANKNIGKIIFGPNEGAYEEAEVFAELLGTKNRKIELEELFELRKRRIGKSARIKNNDEINWDIVDFNNELDIEPEGSFSIYSQDALNRVCIEHLQEKGNENENILALLPARHIEKWVEAATGEKLDEEITQCSINLITYVEENCDLTLTMLNVVETDKQEDIELVK